MVNRHTTREEQVTLKTECRVSFLLWISLTPDPYKHPILQQLDATRLAVFCQLLRK